MIRAAIYARISYDPDARAVGVDRQREDCLRLAASRGWTVVAEYIDNNVSASNGSLLATVAGRGAAAGLRRERQAAVAAAGAAALATMTASSASARSMGSARPAPPATPPATSC